MSNLDSFLNPQPSFEGEFTPGKIVFNANLQEFTNRISIICALETGGKISPSEAYRQIKDLWTELDQSKQNLLADD
jgi:hypothetical protein